MFSTDSTQKSSHSSLATATSSGTRSTTVTGTGTGTSAPPPPVLPPCKSTPVIGRRIMEYIPEMYAPLPPPPPPPRAPTPAPYVPPRWANPGQQEPWMTPLPLPPPRRSSPKRDAEVQEQIRIQGLCRHKRETCAKCHPVQPIPWF
ncbi:hypothetical protein B0H11DRAFT_2231746 [Mycena galericulata]|nr:hypothetical protein B0H11DRAFT_2231746 [Mycena galericulata]